MDLQNDFSNIDGRTRPPGYRLPVLAAALLIGLVLAGQGLGLIPPVGEWQGLILAGLRQVPLWAFMLAFAILPALGFPILAFYMTIGGLVDGLGPALLVSWCCMAANMALSYLVAQGFSKPLCVLARRRGYRIPRIEPVDEWKVVVMMRASPLPWLMQSFLLILGGARFLPYMLFGLPVQALVGLGVIVLGSSLFSGNGLWALIGVCLLMAACLALSIIRRRSGRLARSATEEVSLESV
ncbi:TVP38/TMEM64 family protein [Imhoffiella purpurea]|uniref:TVP38/TMEM64 family membrane protein n=1 Tax=Imhoffiella purpurea TaxID=1249627 RepID=W9V4P5_9GAMM|nr:hypothetical protein [Imhoffiella purpurea]EXJ14508.1 hypothetical protein D779_2649 [Imhoffiella purpurea]